MVHEDRRRSGWSTRPASRRQIAGLRNAAPPPFGQVQIAVAETGEDYARIALQEPGARQIPAWLAEGYATVTAIRPPTQDTTLDIAGLTERPAVAVQTVLDTSKAEVRLRMTEPGTVDR